MTNTPHQGTATQSCKAEERLRRLRVDVHFRAEGTDDFARHVLSGLAEADKTLHPKYLYDAEGARLFDQICDTAEYYPTRTEQALLEVVSAPIIEELRPAALVELGSGASRKTRSLLDAAGRWARDCLYVPVDVSEEMLRKASEELLGDYTWLEIHGAIADYTSQLGLLPVTRSPRLFVFIGSTIGNFPHAEAVDFLSQIRAQMGPEDRLLLGTDLIKDTRVLEAAYNDEAGLTAAFNKNLLVRLNRELDADFDPDQFEHVATFVPEARQMELRLRSRRAQTVRFDRLQSRVGFVRGETILTEISRKFRQQDVRDTLLEAGLDLVDWHTPANEYFALSVARPRPA